MSLLKSRESRFQHRVTSQIMAAIGKVEALIAQREVGDLLVAHRHCQPHPVMEGRIDDFVATEFPLFIGDRDVTNLAAPTFDQRHNYRVRRERFRFRSNRTGRQRLELVSNEID